MPLFKNNDLNSPNPSRYQLDRINLIRTMGIYFGYKKQSGFWKHFPEPRLITDTR
jgi:hypothetical protein